MKPNQRPFWETTALADMSGEQWEALCDGCARCCLHKLQDRETGQIYVTMVACRTPVLTAGCWRANRLHGGTRWCRATARPFTGPGCRYVDWPSPKRTSIRKTGPG